MQQQAQGDPGGALKSLEVLLALALQVRNGATGDLLLCSFNIENPALGQFRYWLNNLGPNKELLRAGLTVLERHEAALPAPENAIKNAYLAYRADNSPQTFANVKDPLLLDILRVAQEVPWEKARHRRISQLITSALLWEAQLPSWETRFHNWKGVYNDSRFPHAASLEQLTKKQWDEYLQRFRYFEDHESTFAIIYSPILLRFLRSCEVLTAIGLYYADQGHVPEDLDKVIPDYLSKLPINPVTGEPFYYRISAGETIDIEGESHLIVPGQALIRWSQKPEWYYPAPLWTVKEKQQ
jgi:hypothetical protein